MPAGRAAGRNAQARPLWSSSLACYRALRRCHRDLTPKYRRLVTEAATSKRVHALRSRREIDAFLRAVRAEIA
jgi:hypothetical protein